MDARHTVSTRIERDELHLHTNKAHRSHKMVQLFELLRTLSLDRIRHKTMLSISFSLSLALALALFQAYAHSRCVQLGVFSIFSSFLFEFSCLPTIAMALQTPIASNNVRWLSYTHTYQNQNKTKQTNKLRNNLHFLFAIITRPN